MKTKILIIVGIVIPASIFLFLIDSGLGSYEGVQIERLSNDGFQRYYNDNDGNLNIVKITDEDLEKVPKIKNLIKKSLQKEFSLTTDYGEEQETNIQVFSGLASYEITHYQKWGEELGLNKGRGVISGSILEYDGQYYRLGFSIA